MRLACASWSIVCALCAVSLHAGELLDGSTTPCESCCPADGCPGDSLGPCCEDCDCFCGQRLLGFLPSDHSFDSFISPISNPFFFEDPRSLTEARGIFINNSLPGLIGSQHAQIWAAQFRGRLTDRWSVIAPRLAYWEVIPRGSDSPIGFLSAPVGVKYNFVRDVERQLLISGGITYFIPGSTRSYTGFGDGDFHFFLTGGKQIYDDGHWLSATGFRIPLDHNWGTQLWYWSNQWDYELPGHIYPLVGLNWYHWMRNSGLGLTGPIAGLDLLNLPAANVAGRDVVTSVVGTKWKPNGNFEVGGGYEFPLTQYHDVLSSRVYADVIFRY